MQAVVLVDQSPADHGDGDVPPAGDGAAQTPDGAASPPARRGRWWLLPLGLAIVAVAGTVDADRRESDRLDTLADIPGILAPVDGPVTEIWHRESGLRRGVTLAAGRLIGLTGRMDGGVDVIALDPQTGAEVWRTPTRRSSATGGWTRCELPPAGRASRQPNATVVCVLVQDLDTGVGTVRAPIRQLAVDARSGAVRTDRGPGPGTALDAIGTDVVLGYPSGDGRIQVTRLDARSAAPRWTFTGPAGSADRTGRGVSVRVDNDLIVVVAGTTRWLLTGGGEVVGAGTVPAAGIGEVAGIGEFAGLSGFAALVREPGLLGEQVRLDGEAPGTELTALSTGRSFAVPGDRVDAAPDDGSLPDVLLVRSAAGDLIGLGAASGQRRWTTPAADSSGAAIIDGRIIQVAGGDLRSLDGRSGRVVWATPVRPGADSSLATDGLVVLLSQPAADRGSTLSAYGLDDGTLRWRTQLPDDQIDLLAAGGRLYGWTEHGIVGFGPRGARQPG